MSKTVYHRTSLTIGETALNTIDGNSLLDGDVAIVMFSEQTCLYVLDADLGVAEYSPGIIVPNTNPGTKCWVLQGIAGDVRAFGAIGDGVTDDTGAIQYAIDYFASLGGGIILLPALTFKIGAASPYFLTLKNHVSIIGVGGGLISPTGAISGTILKTAHSGTHYPAFLNDQTEHIRNFVIKNLVVDFGVETGGIPSTQTEDIGFQFTGSYFPDNFTIDNVTVRNAFRAYYDTSGAWMSTVKGMWARQCYHGFHKSSGTTFNFINCHADGDTTLRSDAKGWHIESVAGANLIGCAMDTYYAQMCAEFINCSALTIEGFDAESNQCDPDWGRIFYFYNSDGISVNGLTTYNTSLHTEAGKEACILQVKDCSGSFNGINIGSHRTDSVDGAGTIAYTFVVQSVDKTCEISLTGSRIATVSGGGFLTGNRYAFGSTASSGSVVAEAGCRIENIDGGILRYDANNTIYNHKSYLDGREQEIICADSVTIDWNNGGTAYMVFDRATVAVTLSNGSNGKVYRLRLTQDLTGGRLVSWVTTIKWRGVSAPTLTTTGNYSDILTFVYSDGVWYADATLNFPN